MNEARIASVVVNRKVAAVDKIFDYTIPEHLIGRVTKGSLVRVPFNRQILEAIVVDLPVTSDYWPLKNISELLAEKPLFSENLLQLARFMADYYLCPYVSALQAMLPAGLSLTGHLRGSTISKFYSLTAEPAGKVTSKQQAALDYVAAVGEVSRLDLMAKFSANIINRLVKNGRLKVIEREVGQVDELFPITNTSLNLIQQSALDAICAEMNGSKKPFLLFGVTGSGKTEIYLQLIEQTVASGKSCLLLVPEIALSTQMLDFLHRRLQIPVALLHSGLTSKERHESWRKIAEGAYPVVVGARSAVFAPLKNLGLLIVDEEHETSYKQDNTPRFHARTVAEERCRLEGAQLVLGSATPAVESFYKAQEGQYALAELHERYFAAPLPQVQIVDMRRELELGNRSMISDFLREQIAETLTHNQQVILFLNRRGYYTFYSCRHCGEAIRCPHCDLPMAYHSREQKLKCHYCGALITPPTICPNCGSTAIRYFGSGTQRIEDEVGRLFPTARLARLDQDAIRKRGSYEKLYREMHNHQIDILVGTQMVAKGLDFPDVTLVGVLAADTTLHLPDWRSGERTFQMLTQIVGRAGRRDQQGLAVIQTYSPEAAPIQAAAKQDYQLFYEQELAWRQQLTYPPFTSLIRLVVVAREQACAERTAQVLAAICRQYWGQEVVLGAAPAPWEKIKDHFRFQILIKGIIDKKILYTAWQTTKQQEHLRDEAFLQIDVDPLNMT